MQQKFQDVDIVRSQGQISFPTAQKLWMMEPIRSSGTMLVIYECGCQNSKLFSVGAILMIYALDFSQINMTLSKKCGCKMPCFQKA